MLSIYKKELNAFFSSAIGYLVIAVFLLINGLFLWVFEEEYNILNAGFADLTAFFSLSPWFFVFLIPAITMRSFSEELRTGTIEILKTKPVSSWGIVLGKFSAYLTLMVLALLPTLTYVFTVYELAMFPERMDFGSIIGSYLGLLLMAAALTAIGLFSSILTKSQIVAFIFGTLLALIVFYGFEALGGLELVKTFDPEDLSMHVRFQSMARGVLDTRDLLYFLSLILFFLWCTKGALDEK